MWDGRGNGVCEVVRVGVVDWGYVEWVWEMGVMWGGCGRWGYVEWVWETGFMWERWPCSICDFVMGFGR